MTGEEARASLTTLPGVTAAGIERLARFAAMLSAANSGQNLVAASTLGDAMWSRHLLDSAQLLRFAPAEGGAWIDVGSGPGLPGLVIALLRDDWTMTLIEPRKLRCDFLRQAIAELGLGSRRVQVVEAQVDRTPQAAATVISARALAPLDRLIPLCRHLAREKTCWLLPKGKNAVKELSSLPPSWQAMFHVEPSLTDADARILVGRGDFAQRASVQRRYRA